MTEPESNNANEAAEAGKTEETAAPLATQQSAETTGAGVGFKPSFLFLGGVSFASLVADLGTKYWAETHLVVTSPSGFETAHPISVIQGVFTFILAKNKGGAWGLLQHTDESIRKPFFITVSVLAIFFIVSLYRRVLKEQWALMWGLPLVLGGALGNLIDRIRYSYVIDFIDIQATWNGESHHWPTFNVADIAICVGVGLMALDMLSGRRPENAAGQQPRAAASASIGEKAESQSPS